MNRKLIIIAAGAGLASFAGAFATGWFTRPSAAMGSAVTGQPDPTQADSPVQPPPVPLTSTPTATPKKTTPRTMTEQQLKDLIYEVREKIHEYNLKLQDLDKEKHRLQIAQQTLKQDIESLNNLRVELAASVADLKNEREILRKTRVEIAGTEKKNLIAIAAAYDKMDPVGASEILTNMAKGPSRNETGSSQGANLDDAVKILFFMQERTKANVLAELVTREPALTATLCQKLKQVQEGK